MTLLKKPKTPARPLIVSFAAMLMLGAGVLGSQGCATGPGEAATGAAADALLPPEEEERLGRELRRDVLQEVQVLDNEEVQDYVSQLGARVVRAADSQPEGIDYTFTVIEDDQLNAFAMPGGDIYVYTGLLQAADSEAELMSVLSHEVAHVTERHIAEQLVAQYGMQALAAAALGNNPGVITQLVTNVAGQGYLLRFSRSAESEADEAGLGFLVRAGYNPSGFISFFRKLERQGGGGTPEFLSSHPSPENRIEEARQRIRQLDRRPSETGEQRYQQMKQQLGSTQ